MNLHEKVSFLFVENLCYFMPYFYDVNVVLIKIPQNILLFIDKELVFLTFFLVIY